MLLLASILCSFLLYVAPCLPPTSHVTLKGAGLCLSFSLITSNSLFSRRRPYHVCGRAALSLALKSTLILPFTHIPTFSQWLEMQGSLNMSCFLTFWPTVYPSPHGISVFLSHLNSIMNDCALRLKVVAICMHACMQVCVFSLLVSAVCVLPT